MDVTLLKISRKSLLASGKDTNREATGKMCYVVGKTMLGRLTFKVIFASVFNQDNVDILKPEHLSRRDNTENSFLTENGVRGPPH